MWAYFILLSDNKADLARFLTKYLLCHGREFSNQYELVTSGRNNDSAKACFNTEVMLFIYSATTKKQTRLILHAQEEVANNYNRLTVLW